MRKGLSILISLVFTLTGLAQNETIELWPGKVPGEGKPKAEHRISPNKKNNVTRIAEVTNPTVDVYLPKASKNISGFLTNFGKVQ